MDISYSTCALNSAKHALSLAGTAASASLSLAGSALGCAKTVTVATAKFAFRSTAFLGSAGFVGLAATAAYQAKQSYPAARQCFAARMITAPWENQLTPYLGASFAKGAAEVITSTTESPDCPQHYSALVGWTVGAIAAVYVAKGLWSVAFPKTQDRPLA